MLSLPGLILYSTLFLMTHGAWATDIVPAPDSFVLFAYLQSASRKPIFKSLDILHGMSEQRSNLSAGVEDEKS